MDFLKINPFSNAWTKAIDRKKSVKIVSIDLKKFSIKFYMVDLLNFLKV